MATPTIVTELHEVTFTKTMRAINDAYPKETIPNIVKALLPNPKQAALFQRLAMTPAFVQRFTRVRLMSDGKIVVDFAYKDGQKVWFDFKLKGETPLYLALQKKPLAK